MKQLILLLCCISTLGLAQPVKIYILAGQSNMEGKGAANHLDTILADPSRAKPFEHLKPNGSNITRPDVIMTYKGKTGPLSIAKKIGPELGFGITVGDANNETILIIKVALGGSALDTAWRSPSACEGDEQTGKMWGQLTSQVQEVMGNIPKYVPGKTEGVLCGFVWFQGFNDVIKADRFAVYEENLKKFIADCRAEFKSPKLPFIIGQLGMSGPNVSSKHQKFNVFQKNAAKASSPAKYVEIAHFVPANPGDEKFDGGYHYLGRFDVYYNIGVEFGKAMLTFGQPKTSTSSTSAGPVKTNNISIRSAMTALKRNQYSSAWKALDRAEKRPNLPKIDKDTINQLRTQIQSNAQDITKQLTEIHKQQSSAGVIKEYQKLKKRWKDVPAFEEATKPFALILIGIAPNRQASQPVLTSMDKAILKKINKLATEQKLPKLPIRFKFTKTNPTLQGATETEIQLNVNGTTKSIPITQLKIIDKAMLCKVLSENEPDNAKLKGLCAFYLECAEQPEEAKRYYKEAGNKVAKQMSDLFYK